MGRLPGSNIFNGDQIEMFFLDDLSLLRQVSLGPRTAGSATTIIEIWFLEPATST